MSDVLGVVDEVAFYLGCFSRGWVYYDLDSKGVLVLRCSFRCLGGDDMTSEVVLGVRSMSTVIPPSPTLLALVDSKLLQHLR